MVATIRNAFDPGFGVYVHWPFCLSKCPYCDFNSHVRRGDVDEDRFVEAFRTEIDHRAELAPGREVRSVFFGGGTPSLMLPSTVEAILGHIAKRWTLAKDAEITLEANPLSVANKIFERSSFDLIYARSGQTAASWKKELEIALSYAGEHLSLYQLTIEPETMFERMVEAGKLTLPDNDAQRALWDVTQELTIRAGLPAYEVSNHARPGA